MKTHGPVINKLINNLDIIVGISGALFGTLIISLRYIINLRQTDIGVTILASCLLYLIFRKKTRKAKTKNIHVISRANKLLLNIVFSGIFGFTVILYHINLYHRPTIYFIMIAVLAGLISIEIIFHKEDEAIWPILAKILILSLNIRGGIFYIFPSLNGYDAYWHVKISELLTYYHHIPPFELTNKYYYYPILHIFISITQLLLNVDIKDALFYSVGISSILATVFVFLIVKSLAGAKAGLLATLFANIDNQLIVRGIANVTPDSLVTIYLLIILYLLLVEGNGELQKKLVKIFLALIIVVTHQLSAFVTLITLIFIYFIKYIYKMFYDDTEEVNFDYILLFTLAMVTYWMYTYFATGQTFFDMAVSQLWKMIQFGGEYGSDFLVVGVDYQKPLWEELVLHTSYLILPFWGIGGILMWLTSRNKHKLCIVITGSALYFLAYAIPLLGIRALLTDRWLPQISIFLVIAASTYILSAVDLIRPHFGKTLAIFTIVAGYSFFMITTPSINKDSPLVAKDTTVRNQFKEIEICTAKTLQKMDLRNIKMDNPFSQALFFYAPLDKYNQLTQKLEPEEFTVDYILNGTTDKKDTSIILRKSAAREPITAEYSKQYADVRSQIIPDSFFNRFESWDYNLFYDNGEIVTYISN